MQGLKEKLRALESISIASEIIRDIKKNKLTMALRLGIPFLLSIYISGIVIELFDNINGTLSRFYFDILSACYEYFSHVGIGLVLSVIFVVIANYYLTFWKKAFDKGYYIEEERGIKISTNEQEEDVSHVMTEEEKIQVLNMDTDVSKVPGPILGIDKKDRVYSLKVQMFMNENMVVNGPPGCGKSICLVNNDVLQTIMAGQSGVYIDTKGAVRRNVAYAALKAGYNVKVFNTMPDQLMYSDACDFFSTFTLDENAKMQAKDFATTLVSNSTAGKTEAIYFNGAINLLSLFILMTLFDNTIPREKRTFGEVYDRLMKLNTYQKIEEAYGYVEDTPIHPAYETYITFKSQRDVLKEGIISNLTSILGFMSVKMVRELVSHNEIDFKKLGTEKTIYFVVISDKDKTNNVLASLFLNAVFSELKGLADSMPNGELPVPTQVVIDEFKQVGLIPMFPEHLSSARSRKISIQFILQDTSQLEVMYPGQQFREILNDCQVQLVLACNDGKTAKFYEELGGKMNIVMEGEESKKGVGELLHFHPERKRKQSLKLRPVYTASEILGKGKYGRKRNELLVYISGEAPFKLKKFMYWNHPIYKALNLKEHQIPNTNNYPEWRKNFKEINYETLRYKNEEEKNNASKNGMETVNINFTKSDTKLQ